MAVDMGSPTLQIGKWTVPKGALVNINVWGIHRDPAVWPQPKEFLPERFLKGSSLSPSHPNAFLGFGLGAPLGLGHWV